MTREEAIKFLELDKKDRGNCLISNAIDMAIKALEQEPKTGHWIVDGISYSEMNSYILSCHCSKCHYTKDFYDRKSWSRPCIENAETFNFCPNCGADMRGEK